MTVKIEYKDVAAGCYSSNLPLPLNLPAHSVSCSARKPMICQSVSTVLRRQLVGIMSELSSVEQK